MSPNSTNNPGGQISPKSGSDQNDHKASASVESPPIWVVNDQSTATVRSRFYKAILLAVSCVFQLVIAGEVPRMYGPVTFFAFSLGIVICAGIAAQEMGALLSAIDMRFTRLKEALVEGDDEDDSTQRAPRPTRT